MAMSTRPLIILASLIYMSATPLHGQPGITVAEIAQRNIAARGGIDAIRSIRTLIVRDAPRADGRPGRFMARGRPDFWIVGDPSGHSYAEGFDGSAWESIPDAGLVLRTSDAPAAAARHTAYFDEALVYFGEAGWRYQLLGKDRIGTASAYAMRVGYPDGYERDVFVDMRTWLVVGYRAKAPVHAFGAGVSSETRVSDYRRINGALFAM